MASHSSSQPQPLTLYLPCRKSTSVRWERTRSDGQLLQDMGPHLPAATATARKGKDARRNSDRYLFTIMSYLFCIYENNMHNAILRPTAPTSKRHKQTRVKV